ncbi:MAG: hypothetical protein J0H29_04185 [Sphingobacteriales bacterium]|nr:hypothetical protein [Sphingobacteriales bacterium]OJY92485.1 MAG: hypothetical protein BGP14_14940 [Sphingobacteriales bacterium 44-15]
MEFKITGKYNETYLEECLTLWKFSSKEAFNSVKTYSICCLAYLAIGLLYYLRGKSISLFISSFGLACFLLLIIQLLNIYQLKTRTKKNLLARIEKYKTNPTVVRELLFTEEYIKYCDPEMLLKLKWVAFPYYQEYGNYIFFFLNESKKPALSMSKINIPESIEKDLFKLINSKIPIRS